MAAQNGIHAAVSYMPEPAFNRALLPLLAAGEVDALEWSFDTVRHAEGLPPWMYTLLREFSDAGRLYGHGVYYSLLSGGGGARLEVWLERLRSMQRHFRFQHLSEHFGFMTSGNAHQGAPLPVPLHPRFLSLGRSRMAALAAAAGVPVGLENLALCFSEAEARQQGAFLQDLVEPVQGFVLLDLHNIYCTAHNFGLDPCELIQSYPLHLVKELHLSGGSWEQSAHSAALVRRDTHDDAVPSEVFSLLEWALPRCPRTDVVVLERLGHTLNSKQEEAGFREDFRRMKSIVCAAPNGTAGKWPAPLAAAKLHAVPVAEDAALARSQAAVLRAFKSAATAQEAEAALAALPAEDAALWQPAAWNLPQLETAVLLGQKWGIEEG